ncbi:cochaperone Sti1 homeolog p [Epichloe bromicola]|uniref:Cochaperone Sti1 homeolog p n=1 Tax=Epichloe bromicola TaxID=79588 RepID=A0ABQ0CW68_9HYPO
MRRSPPNHPVSHHRPQLTPHRAPDGLPHRRHKPPAKPNAQQDDLESRTRPLRAHQVRQEPSPCAAVAQNPPRGIQVRRGPARLRIQLLRMGDTESHVRGAEQDPDLAPTPTPRAAVAHGAIPRQPAPQQPTSHVDGTVHNEPGPRVRPRQVRRLLQQGMGRGARGPHGLEGMPPDELAEGRGKEPPDVVDEEGCEDGGERRREAIAGQGLLEDLHRVRTCR